MEGRQERRNSTQPMLLNTIRTDKLLRISNNGYAIKSFIQFAIY